MVEVNLGYRFSMDGGISQGEFIQVVQDSGRDCAEGTTCIGAILSDVLYLLSLFLNTPNYSSPSGD